jgi:hypothetical protein
MTRVVDILKTYEGLAIGTLFYMLGNESQIYLLRIIGLSIVMAVILINYGVDVEKLEKIKRHS